MTFSTCRLVFHYTIIRIMTTAAPRDRHMTHMTGQGDDHRFLPDADYALMRSLC